MARHRVGRRRFRGNASRIAHGKRVGADVDYDLVDVGVIGGGDPASQERLRDDQQASARLVEVTVTGFRPGAAGQRPYLGERQAAGRELGAQDGQVPHGAGDPDVLAGGPGGQLALPGQLRDCEQGPRDARRATPQNSPG